MHECIEPRVGLIDARSRNGSGFGGADEGIDRLVLQFVNLAHAEQIDARGCALRPAQAARLSSRQRAEGPRHAIGLE